MIRNLIPLLFLTLGFVAFAQNPAPVPPTPAPEPPRLVGPQILEDEDDPRIKPTRLSLDTKDQTIFQALQAISARSGCEIDPHDLGADSQVHDPLVETPLWLALERIAARHSVRIVSKREGRLVGFARITGLPQPSSIDGPFRFVVKQIRPNLNLETGRRYTDVAIDIQWEPRFPVFRIDSQPVVNLATDDKGTRIWSSSASTKVPTSGFTTSTIIALEGVPRNATVISRLSGTFVVTAAERMLLFEFTDPAAKTPPAGKLLGNRPEKRTFAELKRFEKVDDRWEAEFEFRYPPIRADFESFESLSWVSKNSAYLVSPDGTKTVKSIDHDYPTLGLRTRGIYRFRTSDLADPKGWKLFCETPSPLVEYPIRFDFRDIPLP